MSEEIYANTDEIVAEVDSKKKRTIYMDDDIYQNVKTSCPSTREDPSTAQLSVSQQRGRNPSRAAVVCLGLLCVLLLAGITGLGLHYQGFRGQYRTGMTDHQLRYNNLTAERDQLEMERDQIQTSYNNLSAEKENLETRYKTMTAERDQLERKRDQLQRESDQSNARLRVLESPCPQGWWRFSSSCYHISTEKKTWEESRKDCLKRGAHLVVVDSREEQSFLLNFGTVWIGLTDKDREGTWTWTWMDRSLTNGSPKFWADGEPNDAHEEGEDCAQSYFPARKPLMSWNDIPCSFKSHAVCEKQD